MQEPTERPDADVDAPPRRRALRQLGLTGPLLLSPRLLRPGLLGSLSAALPLALRAQTAKPAPAPEFDPPTDPARLGRAILAAGCFWGVQGVYQHVQGVRQALCGYSGGTAETARYEAVVRGQTTHAESVELQFDPGAIRFGELLQILFSVVHDPTELDRQGPDIGPQYRSEIFAVDALQVEVARRYIAQLERARHFPRPIVTRVSQTPSFYRAEAVHQDFMLNHPGHPYIQTHDQPKLDALRRQFAPRVRATPVRVGPPV